MAADKTLTFIKAVLLRDCDPIGIKDEPAAQGEYDGYVDDLARMLRRSALYRNAEHLLDIEVNAMGLRGDSERAHRVAQELCAFRR
jgi:hypothetical protein